MLAETEKQINERRSRAEAEKQLQVEAELQSRRDQLEREKSDLENKLQ